jgi:hypothetical protein
MPRDADPPAPPRRRSRTVRAAALVTIGLGAAGCDETPPPDLPGQTEARLDACRAAHRRLSQDPARCDVLEQVIAREHAASRPDFRTVAACETVFGRGACEGETLAATPPIWRPSLIGWIRAAQDDRRYQPVLRDKDNRLWALPEPALPVRGELATQPPPRVVDRVELPFGPRPQSSLMNLYYQLAPIYPDEATCRAEWQSCDRSDVPLPNRFATSESCRAVWSQCVEVELPEEALSMAVAEAPPATQGGGGTSGSTGSPRASWWVLYNSGYRSSYARGIGPRYQGWTWTGDRRPTAAYRPAIGTGPLQAWDSSTRRLDTANRMAVYTGRPTTGVTGTTVSRPASTISRAGFGSTGRAYSSGG